MAMVGLGKCASWFQRHSWLARIARRFFAGLSSRSRKKRSMSCPALQDSPAPVRTNTFASAATASSASATIISSCICGVMALRFSGRFIVTQAMPSAMSTFTVSNFGNAMAISFTLFSRDQRAVALAHRAERLLGGDRRDHLVEIPVALRLLGRLHLREIHGMELAPVLADAALAEERIVGRHGLHRRDHRLAVGGAARLVDALEEVQHRGVHARLHVVRHGAVVRALLE